MTELPDTWYALTDPNMVDSPAYLVYPDRIRYNIDLMVKIAGTAERLVPHVKTHKMAEPVELQLRAGIRRFKCATISEAEMLAKCGVKEVILAYQLNTSKAMRFLKLAMDYPQIRFSCLVDNSFSARLLNELCASHGCRLGVWVDLDTGMHRSGRSPDIDPGTFFEELVALPWLDLRGLHAYDGHIRETDFDMRRRRAEQCMEPVQLLCRNLAAACQLPLEIIAGGTPTFPVHAQSENLLCSPGTCVLWDSGYAEALPEQHFLPAALVLCRVISKTSVHSATLDLGHKAVAAENTLDKRVRFLNLSGYRFVSQSEEHLVIEGEGVRQLQIGDALYGIPHHICPTTALYDSAVTVVSGEITGSWEIAARKRKCTY